MPQNSFSEASSTLLSKPGDIRTKSKNYRPIFQMNMDLKILKNICVLSVTMSEVQQVATDAPEVGPPRNKAMIGESQIGKASRASAP